MNRPTVLQILLVAYAAALVVAGICWAPTRSSHAQAPDTAGAPRATMTGPSARTGGTAWGGAARSPVYPERRATVVFDHRAHLDLGLTCAPCHARALTSTRASDDLGVAVESCDGCHDTQHPWIATAQAPQRGAQRRAATCETCHLYDKLPSAKRSRRQRNSASPLLVFNHAMHLRGGGTCEGCHDRMRSVQAGAGARASLPSEASCISCHDGKRAADDCRTCHPTDRSGRLRRSMAPTRGAAKLVPGNEHSWGMGHDLNFVERHGAVASVEGDRCAECHGEDECQSCHAGATRPLTIHRPDFVRSHGIEARTRTSDCGTCHRLQSDCLSCHERLGVGAGAGSPFTSPSAGTFHGSGWSGAPGQPQAHAQAARLNISTCVSCHQEDSCLTCHATSQHSQQGLGANPHGAGYAGSLRCRQLANLNRRVCLRCHAPGTPELDCVGFGLGGGLGGGAPSRRP